MSSTYELSSPLATHCAIEGTRGSMDDLASYMDCRPNAHPTLFVLGDQSGQHVKKFVLRTRLRGEEESSEEAKQGREREVTREEGKVSLGAGAGLDAETHQGHDTSIVNKAQASPSASSQYSAHSHGKHFFVGTLVDEKNIVDCGMGLFISNKLLDRAQGHIRNDVTVVDPLRFFSGEPGKTEEEARQAVTQIIRSQLREDWWMQERYVLSTRLSAKQEREIEKHVQSHLHFMSEDEWEESQEGKLVAWQLEKLDDA